MSRGLARIFADSEDRLLRVFRANPRLMLPLKNQRGLQRVAMFVVQIDTDGFNLRFIRTTNAEILRVLRKFSPSPFVIFVAFCSKQIVSSAIIRG